MPRVSWVMWAMVLAITAAAGAEDHPNVVLIVGDDQAWTDYSFMGHPAIKTPHLDALARQSSVFTRGYVPSSLCRPSLMSIISGQYPHQHHVTGNDPPQGADRSLMLKFSAAAPMLPKLLAAKGYVSFQSGKWWEGDFRHGGFTHGMTHGDPSRGGRHGDQGLAIGREGLAPIVDFIREHRSRPFFIWYAPMLPHAPHQPPERLLKKYRTRAETLPVARYQAMCEWFDETCGELLQCLDENKLSDNTLVVFLADNGWIQNPTDNAFAPKSKRSPYDGGLRTPVLLRWPKRIAPARDETTLISSIDLAPTILAACGVAPDPSMSGVNVLDVLNGQAPPRDSVFGEVYSHDVANLDRPEAGLQFRWMIRDFDKIIVPTTAASAEFYDLRQDPHEESNLALQRAADVRAMVERMDRWWTPD